MPITPPPPQIRLARKGLFSPTLKTSPCDHLHTCLQLIGTRNTTSGYRIVAITSAFQAEERGSIPLTRSMIVGGKPSGFPPRTPFPYIVAPQNGAHETHFVEPFIPPASRGARSLRYLTQIILMLKNSLPHLFIRAPDFRSLCSLFYKKFRRAGQDRPDQPPECEEHFEVCQSQRVWPHDKELDICVR